MNKTKYSSQWIRRLAIGPCLIAGLIFCWSSNAKAQSVSNYTPIVSSSNYVTSSSPLPGGGRVQSVTYPAQPTQTDATRVAPTTTHTTIIMPPSNARTASVPNTQMRTTSQVPDLLPNQNIVHRIPTQGYANTNDGFQSVYANNRQVVVASTYQQPVPNNLHQANANQNTTSQPYYHSPVYSASATNGANNVNVPSSTVTRFQSQDVPAASTQPTLPQGSVLQSQAPGQLNWQPVAGQPIPANYRYVGNNVCSPYGTTMYQPAYVSTSRVHTYKPLVPLRKLPPTAYIGQGLLGQPKAYVQGESIRNFFRYILP